jgi:hypothetical protein
MPRAKSPSNGSPRTKKANPETNVATMPEVSELTETKRPSNGEAIAAAETRKHPTPIPINVEEAIRQRAYELFAQRGYAHGSDHDDWLNAEREILARYRQQSA